MLESGVGLIGLLDSDVSEESTLPWSLVGLPSSWCEQLAFDATRFFWLRSYFCRIACTSREAWPIWFVRSCEEVLKDYDYHSTHSCLILTSRLGSSANFPFFWGLTKRMLHSVKYFDIRRTAFDFSARESSEYSPASSWMVCLNDRLPGNESYPLPLPQMTSRGVLFLMLWAPISWCSFVLVRVLLMPEEEMMFGSLLLWE